MMTSLEVAFRAVAVFVVLLVWARVLGKKLISQITFFDFVAGITIGSMGANIIFNPNITAWTGVLGLSIFAGLALLLDIASLKKDEAWVNAVLQSYGISNMEDIVVAQIDQQNQIYLDVRNDNLHNIH